MRDKTIPAIRPTLGAWAGLLLVAEMVCEAAGATLSWKTKSVSGDAADEYLSLMPSGLRGAEGRALMDLLDQLESLSDRIDPRTSRIRLVRPEGHSEQALKQELEELEAAATQTIGDRERAMKWLQVPNGALDGRSPLQALDEGGVAEVYRVLGRVDHGIFE